MRQKFKLQLSVLTWMFCHKVQTDKECHADDE